MNSEKELSIITSTQNEQNQSGAKETRNVIDYFAYWSTEAIKADLDTKRHNFSVLISNKFNDFNIGSVIRNANAFLAKEVIIYGRRKFDKRGTVGTVHYENFKYVKVVEELNFPDSLVVGMDNIPLAVPIETFVWPKDKHVILAFGQEQTGLPQEIIDVCQHMVYIKQYGSVRSLNVGCASAITMFDYCQKVLG
jgi:tRNA G18 (ribose-2'-O)-methylase SpoU